MFPPLSCIPTTGGSSTSKKLEGRTVEFELRMRTVVNEDIKVADFSCLCEYASRNNDVTAI